MSQTLIVCPLKIEMKYLVEGLSKKGQVFTMRATPKLSLLQDSSRKLTVAVGGHGKVQFALQTQYLLSQINDVSSVICVGAAGALAEHVKVGDLVIAEKTIEHDYTERFDLKAKTPEFLHHAELLRVASSVSGHSGFTVHFGSVASGDEDIVDAVRAQQLFEKTQALAVAWEGSGGARACLFHEIPFLEIRAITDNARDTVAESFAENLQSCMHNAADFLERMLAN